MAAFLDSELCRAHLVGVGGAGMSALARLLHGVGVSVTGSDASESPTLGELRRAGLRVWTGAEPARVGGAQQGVSWVVRSAAVPAIDAEFTACVARGYRPLLYAEAVGRLSRRLATLAVAGAHGKTSTTAMLAAALHGGGVDASYLVGGELPAMGGNGYGGGGAWLAVEACEFNRSFLQLSPRAAAILNLDHDHVDYYRTPAELLDAFAAFAARLEPGGLLLVPSGAPAALSDAVADGVRVLRVGSSVQEADVYAGELVERDGCCSFVPVLCGAVLPRVELRVPGRYQVDNALFALGLARHANASAGGATAALADFGGVRRRFELRAGARGATIVDDYAHHPTELRAVLQAARARFPGRRLLAVFQPHQHQRTAALWEGFVAALAGFDECLIPDIYGARENDDHRRLASAEELARAVADAGTRAVAAGGLQGLPRRVRSAYRDGDVVLMLGAGDVEHVIDDVVALL